MTSDVSKVFFSRTYLKHTVAFIYIKAVTVSRRHFWRFFELIWLSLNFFAGYPAIFSTGIRYPAGCVKANLVSGYRISENAGYPVYPYLQ
jgi:hypothetical protein